MNAVVARPQQPVVLSPRWRWGWVDVPLFVLMVSDAFSSADIASVSQALKGLAIVAMMASIAWRGRIGYGVAIASVAVLSVLALNIVGAQAIGATLEELSRYVLPVILMMYVSANIDQIERIAGFFLVVVLSNNAYQLYAYLAYVLGLPTLHEAIFDSGLVLRAFGWIGSVMGFGFLNFAAFLLTHLMEESRRTRVLRAVFLLFALLSFSFKLFPALLAALLLLSRRKLLVAGLAAAPVVVMMVYARDAILAVYQLLLTKIDFYVLIGNSARFESYRVAYEAAHDGFFVGRGIGTFGGPASVKYGSPVYGAFDFDWYYTTTMNTTDTYFPHAFVELGVLPGLIYILGVIFPMFLLRRRDGRPFLLASLVIGGLLLDSLFSFGLNAPVYLYASYVVLFACLHTRELRAAARSSGQ